MEVLYDYNKLTDAHRGLPVDPSLQGVWRYSPILPMTPKTSVLSLGEGGTPLLRANMLQRLLHLDQVYLKDESRNPTLSFKDRKSAVAISKAAEFKARAVANMTAGNAGSSIAAYAARARIPAYVFTIEGISDSKLAKLLSYGAHVSRTKAPTRELMAFVNDVCRRYGMMNLTAASRYNPYVKEGAKTSIFEIYEAMGGSLPDWLVVPVGGGGNLSSINKGLRELKLLGLIEHFPRLVGVQGKYCAPVVEAFEKGLSPEDIPTIQNAKTIAHSILDSWAPDGNQALRAIRESNGLALGVTDEEIMEAMKVLSKEEGLFVEPASAAPLAAVKHMVDEGKIGSDESVALFATGSGSNQPEATIAAWGRPPLIELNLDDFARFIEQ
jgi:threonine synthase